MADLKGKVAVVTGGSRGAGRGIALALGGAGATVYVVGRTTRKGPRPFDKAPGTIDDTAEEITQRGGRGIPVRADCNVPAEVSAVFTRVKKEQGQLHVLAYAAWGGSEGYVQKDWQRQPFWELPSVGWESMMGAGVHGALAASIEAARLMAPRRKGLIAYVTEPVLAKYDRGGPLFWALWMLAHRCINRMAEAMAPDLKKRNIAVVALAPGWMRTERVMMYTSAKEKKSPRFAKSESTEYVGRAVAALAADSKAVRKSGKLLYVADLAREYGFTDIDGRRVPNFYKELKMI